MNPTKKCPTCGAARTGPSSTPCGASPELRRVARATSADPDLPSAAAVSLPPPAAARRSPAPTAAERATAEQQRQAQALDNRLHARLCKLVAKVLDQAGYELSDSQLLRLRQEAKSLRQAYSQQPPEPDPQRRQRLQALFRLHETLHQAVERMASKVLLSWQARTGYFTLDTTWRKRWCDLLAD